MSKAKAILIAAFVVTLAAGVAGGLTYGSFATRPHQQNPGQPPSQGRSHDRDRFAELNLTPDQSAKMREIWSGAMNDASRRQFSDQQQALRKQRDEKFQALLTDPQKAQYDEVRKQYDAQMAEIARAREKVYRETVDKTMQILNPEQRKKYEALLKEWHDRRRRGGASTPSKTTDAAPQAPVKSEEPAAS